jgi:hypothetical protein
MPVTHQLSRVSFSAWPLSKAANLGIDRLRQQRSRAVARRLIDPATQSPA